jgi:hypothetical protein
MTTPPVPAELTLAFPTPGPLLDSAYLDLYLAAEGSDNQKATIGEPSLLPQPWDPPTCRNPQLRAELWTWLQAVVVWFNHEYTWDPDGMIPACWPQHPHLVHEIAVLADQRRRAGIALDSDALEEWHRYSAPGFTERLQTRLKAHCEQDHQPWPARGRHASHTDQRVTDEQRRLFEADIATLGPPQPTILNRPRLALLNTHTGEIVHR